MKWFINTLWWAETVWFLTNNYWLWTLVLRIVWSTVWLKVRHADHCTNHTSFAVHVIISWFILFGRNQKILKLKLTRKSLTKKRRATERDEIPDEGDRKTPWSSHTWKVDPVILPLSNQDLWQWQINRVKIRLGCMTLLESSVKIRFSNFVYL